MRMILGLDEPTSGRSLVNGTPYAQPQRPLTQVGALLDAKAMHGKRRPATAYGYSRLPTGSPKRGRTTYRRSSTMKNTMGTRLPIVIGVVIASVCITQDNYGGAMFALVVCGIASLVLYRKARGK